MNFLRRILGKKVLKPRDIALKIKRLMDSSKTESVFKIYVPYRYRVFISDEDMKRLEPFRPFLIKELIDYIHRYADKQGYHLLGEPEIFIKVDKKLGQGNFKVEPIYEDNGKQTMIFDKGEIFAISENQDVTRVFKKKSGGSPILEVLEGNDEGKKFNLIGSIITIGRREDNQIMINDPNVSRYHARIVYNNNNWQIEDLNSTNGVFINGKRITISPLKSGDKICIGSTLLKFRLK
ncbi:hypothetical protein BBF96_05860 [Anoxybacter fermentans]|uniref:FHA domain-containing protein n=1 Tax=Anoxybacter fermentans TaxID=1323375 RepID=A0A3S9SXI0_9FIRM|nr:DUF3662 and FHA domain-containing protein [Anoxybacter fermentans]AZR72960.1 hypothetical protein BBF96_05860 [Anoxybacter fermentans]